MNKDIRTAEANFDLVKKFLDYANVADASYAMLHYVWENSKNDMDAKIYKADGLTFKDKLENDIEFEDKKNDKIYIKPKGTNTTYACAIEARFQKGKIIGKSYLLFNKTIDNDISKVGLEDKLSDRTIKFVNRFKLLKHCPNTSNGFSATLFEDTQDNNQKIIVMRGTEAGSDFMGDVFDADTDLAFRRLPLNQYLDMIKLYCECVKEFSDITNTNGLIIVGHSLGGALAQLLALSLCDDTNQANVKALYTFNSPGAKELNIDVLKDSVYKIDFSILNAKDKEEALFKKIKDYENNSLNNALSNNQTSLLNAIHKYFIDNKNLEEYFIC